MDKSSNLQQINKRSFERLSKDDLHISSAQVLHLRYSCYKDLRKQTRESKKNTVGEPPK